MKGKAKTFEFWRPGRQLSKLFFEMQAVSEDSIQATTADIVPKFLNFFEMQAISEDSI